MNDFSKSDLKALCYLGYTDLPYIYIQSPHLPSSLPKKNPCDIEKGLFFKWREGKEGSEIE